MSSSNRCCAARECISYVQDHDAAFVTSYSVSVLTADPESAESNRGTTSQDEDQIESRTLASTAKPNTMAIMMLATQYICDSL
jgi:hypothetical protein